MSLLAASPRAWQIRDVWAWNFVAEFDELLAAVARCDVAILALDTEFPGFPCEDTLGAARAVRYWALQQNVDMLQPIQFGIAVADGEGVLQGTWTFNFWFDLATNLYTEESVAFLADAGVDFPRHATEGIDPAEIAWRFGASALFGCHARSPQWLTFSGWYDWGYLLKLLTSQSMPSDLDSFDHLLGTYCPHRNDLRDTLPRGSLDSLMFRHGIERIGAAHTAGSDALATLELFLRVVPKIGISSHSAGPLLGPFWKHKLEISQLSGGATEYSGTPLVVMANVSRGKIEEIVAAARCKLVEARANEELAKVSAEKVVELCENKIEAEHAAPNHASTEEQASEEAQCSPHIICDDDGVCSTITPSALIIGPFGMTLSTALVLLQAVPTLASLSVAMPQQLECMILPWLSMRSLESVDFQKLLLALSTLSILVFGCCYFLF